MKKANDPMSHLMKRTKALSAKELKVIADRLVQANRRWRTLEAEYKRHRWDWETPEGLADKLTTARECVRKLLDKLETRMRRRGII